MFLDFYLNTFLLEKWHVAFIT